MTQRFFKMMSMNSNKRKGRMNPNSNKLGRSKFYSEKNMSCDGIYSNSKVMYAGASLVGCVVQIQVQNGAVYEGVLRTFSHQLDIVLEMAHKINTKCPPVKGISPTVSNLISSYPFEGGIHEKIIFKLSDVIMMQACNVDIDYAIKDNFTDSAISKFNGQVKERELEPWEGAGSDSETPLMLTMDDEDGMNGWDANDMFRTNAEKYGVKSSYDNSLQEYTVPLTKKDTEEYKQQEAKAMKIAQEIETNSSYQSRIQLENGDEEDRFSAVVRPADDAIPSKYVLPQKRRNAPGLKRQTSTTSSPVHLSSGKTPYAISTQHPLSNIPGQAKQYPVIESSHRTGAFPSSVTSTGGTITVTPSSGTKNGTIAKIPAADEAVGSDTVKLPSESPSLENVPAQAKMQVLCAPPPQQTLPPRIERRRENEKKFAKQKGRMDEIEDFKKFSKNFNVLTEEKESTETEEGFQSSESKVDPTTALASKMERVKVEKEEDKLSNLVKFSTLNPNAEEFVFNPTAKLFTTRSVSTVPPSLPVQPQPPPPAPPQRIQDQGPMMTVPPSQMIPSLQQPIFTAMAPQYVMQAPVSVALTSPFATASPVPQTPRYRKTTGQPLLAPAAIQTPSQLTVQYTSPPGVLHASAPPQQTVGYPQMNFVVGPRVVSPQPVGIIPTSHSVSYCDTSHLPTHLIMSAHTSASNPHSLQQQGQHSSHHPPQSQTPVIHTAPSPVHQVSAHSQPPTPTAVMYPGGGTLAQHPLQAAGTHHAHSQPMGHPMHHHPGFHGGAQPLVLMQQQQPPSHHGHHHSLHHHHMHPLHAQNAGGSHLLPQMTLIPTSAAMTTAPTSIATPHYVQHP